MHDELHLGRRLNNDGAGNLTPLPGSPYLTGGAGVPWALGQPDALVDADQQVIINPQGTLLFAVNAHTNTIATFTINSDGSLTAASGSPFPSGGQEPISLGLKDLTGKYIVTVVNKDSDPSQTGGTPNYTNFNVTSTGVMKMAAGSTYNLPSGASPGQVLERPGTTLLFGIEFMNKDVASYQFNGSGKLMADKRINAAWCDAGHSGRGVSSDEVCVFMWPCQRRTRSPFIRSQHQRSPDVRRGGRKSRHIRQLAGGQLCGYGLYSAKTGSGTLTVYDIASPRGLYSCSRYR